MEKNLRRKNALHIHDGRSQTNLYDLIEAISNEIEPGEDGLIPEAIQHLFDTGQARFTDCHTEVCGGH
jgi:hypothetical protein